MILLVAAAGSGLAAGIWLVVAGIRPAAGNDADTGRFTVSLRNLGSRLDSRRLGLAAIGALVAALLVRWPVVVAAAAVAGWLMPAPGQRARRSRAEGRTLAIAQWCEMLRDAAGTARGLEGILAATAASAPEGIRPELQRMSRRLEHEPLEAALDGLAKDLAHPVGDLVVTALRVAATAGSRRVASVLGNLATAAHHEASMRQRLDVARARPRSTMRLVAAIVGAFVAGLAIFAREYLAPYSTPLGQVVLLLIGFYWGAGFWWMAKLGQVPEVDRFLLSGARPSVARQ